MKKKIIISLFVFVSICILSLYLTTQLSKAHKHVKAALINSIELSQRVGKVGQIILIGTSLKDNSVFACRSLRYLVLGKERMIYLEVKAETTDREQGQWIITEMISGYYTPEIIFQIPRHQIKCGSGL